MPNVLVIDGHKSWCEYICRRFSADYSVTAAVGCTSVDGESISVITTNDEEKILVIKDLDLIITGADLGEDLVQGAKIIKTIRSQPHRPFLIGTSGTHTGAAELDKAGADACWHRLGVPQYIRAGRLKEIFPESKKKASKSSPEPKEASYTV